MSDRIFYTSTKIDLVVKNLTNQTPPAENVLKI